ncbi:hypothetical protein XFF6992_60001 [Xanthomonas citri pv. fuscans]|nr:hypothetical protein XFF6992_60001 [Xanthomonas citri pv. fuscans]
MCLPSAYSWVFPDGCLPPYPHPNPSPAGGRGALQQRPADCLLPPAGEGARRADGGQPLATRKLVASSWEEDGA